MARRKSMQISVEMILKAHGKEGSFQAAFILDRDFYLKLEKPNFDPLVIEKVGPDRVAVGHFFIQNGDAVYDPEIVFSYHPEYPDVHWVPVEITQPPVYILGLPEHLQGGGYRAKFFEKDGKEYVDMRFDRDVNPLVQVWARNLRHQGWDTAAITGYEGPGR